MNYDVSLIVPSIRTQNWQAFIDSVYESCGKYNWEIIFIGPFCDNEIISNSICFQENRIKHIKSFDSVPVCIQKACIEAQGELIFHTVDDGLLLPNTLDTALDFYYDNCSVADILNARYIEGDGFSGLNLPDSFWIAGTYPTIYGQKCVNPFWRLSLQPIMNAQYFRDIGGFDCEPEYSNFCHIDLSFRVQALGGKIWHTPINLTTANHGQNDHGPIQAAQEGPDQIIFDRWWNSPREPMIDYNNYQKYEGRWARRFSKEYESYEEMCEGEKYET